MFYYLLNDEVQHIYATRSAGLSSGCVPSSSRTGFSPLDTDEPSASVSRTLTVINRHAQPVQATEQRVAQGVGTEGAQGVGRTDVAAQGVGGPADEVNASENRGADALVDASEIPASGGKKATQEKIAAGKAIEMLLSGGNSGATAQSESKNTTSLL